MIKIAICDDEKEIRSDISSLVKKQNEECEIIEYSSAYDCLAADKEHDILFLGIEMKYNSLDMNDSNKNGMWLAREIRNRDAGKQPIIIFVTSYQQFAFDSIDVDAFHYLLKPIDTQKFAEVFHKAVKQVLAEQQNRNLVIQHDRTDKSIPLNHIHYVASNDHKVRIHTKDGEIECYAKMEDLETELRGQFYRIHRGYLVNLSHIDKYNKMEITLTGGDKLPISRYRYDNFVKAYLEFVN